MQNLKSPKTLAIACTLVGAAGLAIFLAKEKGPASRSQQSSGTPAAMDGSSLSKGGANVGQSTAQGSASSSTAQSGQAGGSQNGASGVAGSGVAANGSGSAGTPSDAASGAAASGQGQAGAQGASSAGGASVAVSGSGSAGASGSSGASAPAAGQQPQAGASSANGQQQAAAAPAQTCFTVAYKHKATPGHTDMDACGGHRNLVRIKRGDLNKKTVCVRVDGTPVHYDLKTEKDQTLITLGPIAGPGSKVSVRYCVGKASCDEECTVPKDEFMAAIGGDDADEKPAKGAKAKGGKLAKWDPKDNEKDVDVSEELESEIERELAGDQALAVFEGWSQESEGGACGQAAQGPTLVSQRQ